MKKLLFVVPLLASAMVSEIAAQSSIVVGNPKLSDRVISRDENVTLTIPLKNNSPKEQKTTIDGFFVRRALSEFYDVLGKNFSQSVTLAPNQLDTLNIEIKPYMLQTWRNGSKTSAPGSYTLFVGNGANLGTQRSVLLTVEDKLIDKSNAYGAPHIKSNPFKDALLPVPETAIFKMAGYSLWCPSIIEHKGKYHLFCSRWVEGTHWGKSEIIRASAKSMYGPYKFEEVVLTPTTFPYKFGQTGLHNPKIIKVDGEFYLYYLALPYGKTAFAKAKSPEGKWEVVDHIVLETNNPSICQNADGSIYAVGKENIELKGGGHFRSLQAFTADNILGPYKKIEDGTNRLPNNFEHEDPTLWRSKGQYNVILTDWAGKVTNEQKSVIYFTSKDGVDYDLYSPISIWRVSDPVPVSYDNGKFIYDNGKFIKEINLKQIERPDVHLNAKGEVDALCVGVIPVREGDHFPGSFIMIRPVDKFKP